MLGCEEKDTGSGQLDADLELPGHMHSSIIEPCTDFHIVADLI